MQDFEQIFRAREGKVAYLLDVATETAIFLSCWGTLSSSNIQNHSIFRPHSSIFCFKPHNVQLEKYFLNGTKCMSGVPFLLSLFWNKLSRRKDISNTWLKYQNDNKTCAMPKTCAFVWLSNADVCILHKTVSVYPSAETLRTVQDAKEVVVLSQKIFRIFF
jgi:hypothetical protein